MDKVKRGNKHICLTCMCKFYDFNNSVAICPKCGEKKAPPKEAPKIIENKLNANNQEDINEDNSLEEEVHFDEIDKSVSSED